MLQLNYLLISYRGGGPMSEEERFWNWVIIFVMLGGTFVILIYRGFMKRGGRSWDLGVIPRNFKPTEKNIFELFVAASGAIVRRDLDNHYMKFSYIDQYLEKNFGDVYYHAIESYTYSLNYAVKIDSLASWSNEHLSEEWKIKLINFLAGIACYDGGVNLDEQRHLLILMSKLNLEITDFDPVYREKLTRQNERRDQARTSYSKTDFFYKVLGLEKTASVEEVKDAYRRLVKLTHPDRFMKESQEVQNRMSEKFREIQTAYESIVNP
ncbi:MAG: heat shock protein DnaJ domain protein [Fluviicola sp.]|jgi:hypothetical protein|uniref:J domain-containing protein n=1 Tax=Fluviicola sp. TaxID=1917219 RepID=UPI002606B01B|nr:J domain-containing protein [Fluviicola sp.]MDF3026366.1 heat shock protein DnaJ domain protein [Fluviicola sp.]